MSDFFQNTMGRYMMPGDPEGQAEFAKKWDLYLTPEQYVAARYGGGMRGMAGERYNELGAQAAGAENRRIGMSMGEQVSLNDIGGSRGFGNEALSQWQGQALGTSPSMAQEEAARQTAMARGNLQSAAASARGGAQAAAFARRQAATAGSVAEGDIATRGYEQGLAERERARQQYMENAGRLRGMEQGLYSTEMGRTLMGQQLNDARSYGLYGMQEGVANNERRARQDWVDLTYGQAQGFADREARAAEAAAERSHQNAQQAISAGMSAGTGGLGAYAKMSGSKQPAPPPRKRGDAWTVEEWDPGF